MTKALDALASESRLRARLPLFARQLATAQAAILAAFRRTDGRCAVAFSGGKDSAVVLHMARGIAPEIPAVFVDSGAEFPETLEIMDRTDHLIVVNPAMTYLEMIEEVGAWGATTKSPGTRWKPGQVLENLVRQPMREICAVERFAGIFTGLRAAESRSRKRMAEALGSLWKNADGIWRCEPLSGWTDAEVWAYIFSRDVDLNGCYAKYATLGVPLREWRVSTYADSSAVGQGRWQTLRRGWPELWRKFADLCPEVRHLS